MIILPIIAYDTAPYPLPFQCPQASGLRVSQEDNNCAVLMWNSDNASMWQISYGPAGTEPENGTVIENMTTIRNLCGLDSATQYVAYVRSVCNHEDSTYYSEWSDSVSIHGPAQQEYIRDALDLYTYLMPNPTTNEVQIYSSFFLTGVEIYDIKGQRRKSIAAEGLGVKLDISDLPSGVYVVVIHTPNGIATKKMVVN